ncbi:hypothetical protein [[Phormidium] sp. ETS-05]|uniref:hypothetical protein n=1 Tax=[Phormidium] sp. ETS-05 TaxID=222819 RepID=UPI0018EF1A9F|nr:hypothetical protein [[Phormidium] sp. ETS-05]
MKPKHYNPDAKKTLSSVVDERVRDRYIRSGLEDSDFPTANSGLSPDALENKSLERLQLFYCLMPVVGVIPSLWILYHKPHPHPLAPNPSPRRGDSREGRIFPLKSRWQLPTPPSRGREVCF